MQSTAGGAIGPLLVLAGGAGAAAVAMGAWFDRMSGIAGTPGAAIVIASGTALMLAALAMMVRAPRHEGIDRALNFLTALGILGTALAGWFLMQPRVQVAMALAATGWLVQVMRPDIDRGRGARAEVRP